MAASRASADAKWLILAKGAPTGARRIEELPLAGAYRFLDELVRDFSDIDPRRCAADEENVVPRIERIVSGFCGTEAAGYRWEEWYSLESSAVPAHCQVKSYGLSGLEVEWTFFLKQVGQAGYAGFVHLELRVLFLNLEARSRFEKIWKRTFGGNPTWTAEEVK